MANNVTGFGSGGMTAAQAAALADAVADVVVLQATAPTTGEKQALSVQSLVGGDLRVVGDLHITGTLDPDAA